MLNIKHKSVSLRFTLCIITFIFGFLFFGHSCFAANNNQKIPDSELNMFSQNDIMFYNPFECISRGGSNSCFKIKNSTEAQDFWYAEGCLDNGTCTSGVYASTAYTSHGRNEFLLSDTETDEDFGGMQYIYAENYDIEYGGYEGWIAKFTKNGGNSTKKYYWIVLPDQAYSTGFGETYVATFENLSEPVYFITYDVHACQHQSEDYCGKAKSDPDGVQIGKEFLGAFTKNGGNYNEISKVVGKLTSLCRISGQGEVTAAEDKSASDVDKTGGGAPSSGPPSNSGKSCTTYQDDYPQYYQSDYENSDHENSDQDWTEIPYGNGNVASSGCGPTSMAMLTTVATGQDVYPQDIINITKATGSYTTSSPTTLDPLVGEKYGFEVVSESYSSKKDAYNKIKEYLNDGYMIHLSGEGSHAGFSTSNTAGHYVGIFSIDNNDKIWVANSNHIGNSQVELQDIIDAIHNGVFTAIKGSGGGGSCGGYCDADPNNSVGEEGLTIDQAKQFMMNYGENKNNSSKEAVGDSMWNMCNGGGSNCVTFSAFFMVKFAGIPASGRWGDGQQVVDNLKARGSVDATFGTEPRVYAIISTPKQHTAVVLGHHDGKWILGHASCSYNGKGKGNGGNGDINNGKGGGSGFIAIEDSDDPVDWQWVNSGYSFTYPDDVDTTKIAEYLTNGV